MTTVTTKVHLLYLVCPGETHLLMIQMLSSQDYIVYCNALTHPAHMYKLPPITTVLCVLQGAGSYPPLTVKKNQCNQAHHWTPHVHSPDASFRVFKAAPVGCFAIGHALVYSHVITFKSRRGTCLPVHVSCGEFANGEVHGGIGGCRPGHARALPGLVRRASCAMYVQCIIIHTHHEINYASQLFSLIH